MKPTIEAPSQPAGKKPRLALLVATAFGLGYLPLAPGTWGSLPGLVLVWTLRRHRFPIPFPHPSGLTQIGGLAIDSSVVSSVVAVVVVAAVGVWAAGRAAKHFGQSDPQKVVIDEVSGQMIALLGAGWTRTFTTDDLTSAQPLVFFMAPNWKYLLLGFILFRAFDIWKPFPARRAERLPGGWGIMTDDWVAAIYAALGLCVARALGL